MRNSKASSGTLGFGWLPVLALLVFGADLVGLIVLGRRLTGVIPAPVSTAAFALLLAGITALAATAAGLYARSHLQGRSRELDGLAAAFCLATPVLSGLALVPLHSWFAWAWLGASCAAIAVLVFVPERILPPIERGCQSIQQALWPLSGAETVPKTDAEECDLEAEFIGEAGDEPAENWMKRSRGEEGAERIEGVALAEFAPGQKQATVHLAFCPPLSRVPTLDCDLLGEASVRAKVGAVYAYGARVELKRTGDTAAPLTVSVHYATG